MLRFALTLKAASILVLSAGLAGATGPAVGEEELGSKAKKIEEPKKDAEAKGKNEKPLKYEEALKKSQKEEKPLLILVGARWCASCEIMKNETIEPMKKAGELDNVIYTHVDKDKRPELAEQLMKGATLPQVVLFSKRSGAWKRFSLTGMQSRTRMTELFGRAKIAIRNKSQLR
ncbi:MAG TPA: hypothetical protein DDW52_12815 [Planctomycetaceae bacterium]|nr:hypothetical protein [Planctomycetaceae bacterium]